MYPNPFQPDAMMQDVNDLRAEMGEMSPDLHEEFVEERQETAEESHLVAYMDACVKESFELSRDRRERDVELWKAHESEMAEMHDKEDWQSQIILNQPFATVQQAAAVVRRGLFGRSDHMFLEPWQDKNPEVEAKTAFWRRALKFWGNRPTADTRLKFVDAARYGFAVGISGALKFTVGEDVQKRETMDVANIEPWKLYYDQKRRMPRNSQSGLYAIHEEVMDLYEIKEAGRDGLYINTDMLTGSTGPSDEVSEFAEHARQFEVMDKDKDKAVYKNKYRKEVTVREFYGTVLDEDGDLLLPNAHFVTANGILIKPLEITPFPTMRWPWVDFSPMPHPSKYHGYGIYQGTLGLWRFMCTALNLYIDNENFNINNMYEVEEDAFLDTTDGEFYPGRKFRKKSGRQGPGITPVRKSDSNVHDMQFMWGLINAAWQEGTSVNQFVTGQATGKNMTATEKNISTQQSMGVLDSMIGKDTEDGYVEVMKLQQEFLQTYWNPIYTPYYHSAFADDPYYQQLVQQELPLDQKMEAMALEADVRVFGISRAFEKAQIAQEIMGLMQLGQRPAYAPYAKPLETFRKYSEMIDQPELVKSDQELLIEQQKMEMEQQMSGLVPKALAAAGLGPEEPQPGQGPPQAGGGGQPPPQAAQGTAKPTATNPGDIPAHM